MADKAFRKIALLLVKLYRFALSPWLGGGCRFTPSCSEYALDAFQQHTTIKASGLVLYRLCRCHPLGGHGYDPVPAGSRAFKRFAHE